MQGGSSQGRVRAEGGEALDGGGRHAPHGIREGADEKGKVPELAVFRAATADHGSFI